MRPADWHAVASLGSRQRSLAPFRFVRHAVRPNAWTNTCVPNADKEPPWTVTVIPYAAWLPLNGRSMAAQSRPSGQASNHLPKEKRVDLLRRAPDAPRSVSAGFPQSASSPTPGEKTCTSPLSCRHGSKPTPIATPPSHCMASSRTGSPWPGTASGRSLRVPSRGPLRKHTRSARLRVCARAAAPFGRASGGS